MSIRTTVFQKFSLIVLGILMAMVILETGMRIAGFIITKRQDIRNRISSHKIGTYRIICIGESTTQNEYPPFLEEILNQSGSKNKFSVIDNGRIGTTTHGIMGQIELWLDQYHPDMVVAMMGINDQGAHLPRGKPQSPGFLSRLSRLKIYKLSQYIALHLKERGKESELLPSSREIIDLDEQDDSQDLISLGVTSMNNGDFASSEEYLNKAKAAAPKNPHIYMQLGLLYKRQGLWHEAERNFGKSMRLDSQDMQVCCYFAGALRKQFRLKEAEKCMIHAQQINWEKEDCVYRELGNIYMWRGMYELAEESFKKAIELDPKNTGTYFELATLYRKKGVLAEAEDYLHKALALDPDDKAKFYGALAVIRGQNGDKQAAQAYFTKSNSFSFAASATNNYLKLKKILDKRGIQLVCVQYPMRDVGTLKAIFSGQAQSILFVDNEMTFKNKLKSEGYAAYFRDSFAGDFGHCTKAGNRLLAGRIAKVILEKVFQ